MAPKSRAAKPQLEVEYVAVSALIPDLNKVRRDTSEQIARLARIIDKSGWPTPIAIDEPGQILVGYARLQAAKLLGMKAVPCVRLAHLTRAQKYALAAADNRLARESTFDDAALRALLIECTQPRVATPRDPSSA